MSFIQKDIPLCREDEYEEIAWGIKTIGDKHSPFIINWPKVSEYDVKFEIKYCGICHSDCHYAYNDLGGSIFPMVTGHEITGTVVEVGAKVTKVKVGDNVGVGCIVDSCLECELCKRGDE